MLIIHGLQDRLINCSQGQQLWELCPHKKKLFVCPEQMSHNTDLLSNADFLIRPMLRFFALPDYSFVDLVIPAEAFDKRHCPQYHKLVETVKGDGPLPRPHGDEEECPVGVTTAGPKSVLGPFAASRGDDDGMEESGEFTVRSPRLGALAGASSLSWSISRQPTLIEEVSAIAEHSMQGIPEVLEQLQPLAAMSAAMEFPGQNGRVEEQRSSHEVAMEMPAPVQRSARAPGLYISSSTAGRIISGPVRQPLVPADIGVDVGFAVCESPMLSSEGPAESEDVWKKPSFDGIHPLSKALEKLPVDLTSAAAAYQNSQAGPCEEPRRRAECRWTNEPSQTMHVDREALLTTIAKAQALNNIAPASIDDESQPESDIEAPRVPLTSDDGPLLAKSGHPEDSAEGQVVVEHDVEWTMPTVPLDTLPSQVDPEWTARTGTHPVMMFGRLTQTRSHDATDARGKAPTVLSGAQESADAATMWEEGSTGAPPTAEASHLSRRSEEGFRDADFLPVPGLCILRLDAGISRFLRDSVDLES
jgi:hypothetical protein